MPGQGESMDPIAFYMNALYAMYDLCFLDQQAPLLLRAWSLPNYGLTVDITSTNTYLALWGVQATVSIDVDAGFFPIIAKLFWEENFKGQVGIFRRPLSDHNITAPGNIASLHDDIMDTNSSLAIFLQSTNARTSLATSLDVGGELSIIQTFDGESLTSNYVFTVALAIMQVSAERGPDVPCLIIRVSNFDMTSELDAYGAPLLRYRHVIKAMRVVPGTMVKAGDFREIDIVLEKNGVKIAQGRLKAGGVGGAVTSVN